MGFDIPNRTPLDYLSISLSHSESLECVIVSVLDGVNIPVYSGTDPYTLQNLLLAFPLSKSYCHFHLAILTFPIWPTLPCLLMLPHLPRTSLAYGFSIYVLLFIIADIVLYCEQAAQQLAMALQLHDRVTAAEQKLA